MIDIDKFWAAMSEAFGQRWVGGYGDTPTDAWRADLSTLSDAEVRYGYRALISRGSDWPPTLPEFVVIARGGGTGEQRARDARIAEQERLHYERKQALLPKPEALMPRSDTSRRWVAYCLRTGLMRSSRYMTREEADELLSDDEIEQMRAILPSVTSTVGQPEG